MNNNTNLTVLHCIFYIYHVFALNSDGKLSANEKKIIGGFMLRWLGQDRDKMTSIINATLNWSSENIKNINDQMSSMMSMVEFLKNQNDFTLERREYFLMDIRNIARSDGKFIDIQKKWHDMLANILDVDIRISNVTHEEINSELKKVPRRKIGFRR